MSDIYSRLLCEDFSSHLIIPRFCEGGKIIPAGQWENHPCGTMGKSSLRDNGKIVGWAARQPVNCRPHELRIHNLYAPYGNCAFFPGGKSYL